MIRKIRVDLKRWMLYQAGLRIIVSASRIVGHEREFVLVSPDMIVLDTCVATSDSADKLIDSYPLNWYIRWLFR